MRGASGRLLDAIESGPDGSVWFGASRERQYLDAISSSGRTLLTLINDILDLCKIEAGKLELQYEPVNIPALVDEIQKFFSIKAGEKGINLLTEIDLKPAARLVAR